LAQGKLREPSLRIAEGGNCRDSSPAKVRRAQNDTALRTEAGEKAP
jgi:hypothetical protein